MTAKQIFLDRKKEIEIYLLFLKNNENTNHINDLYKILKSNTILMLYNIIEAVISSAIEDIRNRIYTDNTTDFDNLKQEIKIQIIKDLKININPKDFIKLSTNITRDIIKNSFNKNKISNGNISRDTIRKLSEIYGFQIIGSDYSKTHDGKYIKNIKDKRNDLAHGTFSFAEIGKNYSFEDIEKLSNTTIYFLDYILESIENYLQNQEYKI